jgi:LysM repeat protein
MSTLTMLDRGQAPPAATAVKALATASRAAGTPGPGAWAFYLGGAGHNHGRGTTYTNAMLDDLVRHGIRLLPIYVGAQSKLARARGASDAKDAIRLTRLLGDRNKMLCADIERATADANLPAAVEYVSGWTETLHTAGFRSMAYCSVNLAEELDKHGRPKPDAVWVPRYRAHRPEPKRDPHNIPGIAAQAFSLPGQRAWQYGAEFKDDPHDEKPVRCDIEGINVDVSAIDAEVFGPAPAVSTTSVAPAPAVAATAQPQRTHVVHPGDTLSKIEAELHLKSGSLFAANQELLDRVARQRGKPDSGHGDRIFPGTTLVLP